MRFLLLILTLQGPRIFSQDLQVIRAIQIDSTDYRFEQTIEKYKTSENWTIWSIPMRKCSVSSSLKPIGKNSYGASNLSDLNLETAWVEGVPGYGIGEKIIYTIHYNKYQEYGSAYQFFGQLNIFNGYCKSLTHWTENSRIKTLRVYYNSTPVCLIELIDTWQFQTVSIEQFFQNRYSKKHLNAPYRIIEGTTLSFEILEAYPGTKYDDVSVSEFLIEGAKN
jgi:hypothetical protein